MNPEISAWEGAQFIDTNTLTLDATSALLFDIETDFQIVEGNTASLIIGANYFRFNDKFQNINNMGVKTTSDWKLIFQGWAVPRVHS